MSGMPVDPNHLPGRPRTPDRVTPARARRRSGTEPARRRAIAAFLLYLVFGLFIFEDVLSIGVDPKELQRQYVLGVPTRDIALVVGLLVLTRWIRPITRHVNALHLAAAATLLAGYLALGIWNSGLSNQLNGDVRIGLSFFAGIAVAFLLMRTSASKRHMQVLLVTVTACMVLASFFSPDYSRYVERDLLRVSHPEVYIFSRLAAAPIVLLGNLSAPSLVAKAVPLTCLGFFALFSAVLTSARSQLIVTAGILILVLRSFSLRNDGDVAIVRAPAMIVKLATVVALVAGVTYLTVSIDPGRLTRFTSITQRGVLLGDPRVDELKSFLSDSTPMQLALGKGLGGTVPSPIYDREPTPVMHVGVMNVWMKLGFVPFVAAVAWVYWLMPVRYLRSFRRLRRRESRPRYRDVARVVIWPALLPWMLWSLLSGGFSEQDSVALGWVYFMSGSVARAGLGRWLGRRGPGRRGPGRARPTDRSACASSVA